MADGSHQDGFNFPRRKFASALRPGEIVVDFFAGGGGASEALRQALGRDPDVAVNHDHLAISMHAANHPFTRHMEADAWTVDILREVNGRKTGWFHSSPDCTHFSQAKGGQPRDRQVRSLAWVIVKVAGILNKRGLAPRIISLENVKQMLLWSQLVAKRDKATGRVVRLDGSIAAPGERVPLREQFLVPDKKRAGSIWRQFVGALRALGYVVEHRLLKACDYGAGTSRERLFLIARRDGEAIRWPEPTHGPGRAKPYVTAADCIDWSIECPSIFQRKKPLADATCRRIAKGIQRYVITAAEPFIVQCANASANGVASSDDPLGVITAWPKGGSHAVIAPTLVQAAHGDGKPRGVQRWGSGHRHVESQLGAITASGGHAVAAAHLIKFRGDSDGGPVTTSMPTITSGAGAARPAGAAHAMGIITTFLEQANGGGENGNPARARGATEPVSSITGTGSQQRIVTGHLTAFGQNAKGTSAGEPLQTALGGATRFGVVECTLSPEHEAGALRVAAFLIRYYGEGGQHGSLRNPAATMTTKERLALVTVTIQGTPYVIVDIGLRMLRREELFRAQGFPADYIIDRTADGRKLSISASVRMVGNSVSPPPLAALARANLELNVKNFREAA
ncbi:Modification methylase BspRI [Dyella sp. AD56]|uniref:DNA cytosine methyltransferase n=1 Tax=Dyella sp. AD56 TaxID=1528744 RepID=UPI000C85BD03|nr:DNA cytosine methyltransferase [Dyella sp. AD56]PMQ04213.1 Modification methylase BspRI [Dyella sp. AD56]